MMITLMIDYSNRAEKDPGLDKMAGDLTLDKSTDLHLQEVIFLYQMQNLREKMQTSRT